MDLQSLWQKQSNNTKQTSTSCSSQAETSSQRENPILSDNDTCSQSSYGSSPNENFFFSSETNSGYLDCIVPDNCLKPPSHNKDSANSSNPETSLDQTTYSNLSYGNNNVLPVDSTMAANPENFSCYEGLNFGCWDNEQSWGLNSCELSAVINNPLMGDNGCMETYYPPTDNTSYESMAGATTSSSASFSPVFPPYGW